MTTPPPAPPLRSFWMTGYEGADHLNRHGTPLDMQAASGHLDHLAEDHRAAAALGLRTVRESIGWRLAEPQPGRFDFARATRIAASAQASGLQVLWSCMHYGTPADVSLLDDGFIERYAVYAEAVARWLAGVHRGPEPPIVNPINEIGYLAWVVSETDAMQPYRGGSGGQTSAASGFVVKRRLVQAALAGMAAMRRVLPELRFLHVEPLVHVVAPPGRPDLAPLAERIAGYQWQVWDMLCGRLEPALGGHAEALDLIGVNCYHSGQWEAGTEKRLAWHLRDPRRKRLSLQLQEAQARYGRPILVAETGHFGVGRADWLDDIAGELREARRAGVALDGCCLYPAVDRPDWDDASHWHHSGLWDVSPAPPHARQLHRDYAGALARWQAVLPAPAAGTGRPCPHITMPTLIVFSHLRWGFVYQRPQHILARLARTHRVLFVEEPVFGGAACSARFETATPAPGVTVLTPHTPVEAPGFHDDQLPALRPLLAETLRAEGITDYIAWFYTPMALPLIAELPAPTAVAYDCMDELAAFKDAPRQLRQRETALMKIAGVVFTGGPALYAAKRGQHANLHCLPSAVDAAHYAPERLDRDGEEAFAAARLQADIPAPRLGYFGVIDERLDLGLIAAVADARPEWQIVMAGPVAKISTDALPQRPNIHWLGMQPYERLPHLVAAWHVCLMPFALNEATRCISPTKTLEYMAAEKPVVSTAVPDVVALYGDVVNIAHDRAGFVGACEAMLAEGGQARGARLAAMQSTVARLTWDATAATVDHMLGELLRRPSAASPAALRELAGLGGASSDGAGAGGDPADPVQRARMRRGAGSTATHAVRHLVIGAGPTGLACAYQLGLDAPADHTLLVEREARVGGYCRSSQVAGFTFDQAGHIMFSSDPEVLALYDTLLGGNLHWQDREAWIYSHGVHTRYPFQGALHGLPPAVLKDCLVGAIEARYGPIDGSPRTVAANEPPRNFEEFIHRVWGAGIARHFAIPYNRKLWAVPLAEMETSWLGNRVPLPDLAQMIDGALEPVAKPMGPNARFGYPLRGGFQALMDAFLPHLQCELALQTRVTHVSPSRRSVRLDDGRTLRFESLVSSMPLPQLVAACGDEAPAEVRTAAQALRHVSVRCVNLGIGREALTDKHWIYYPEDTVFHRIFVQGNASPHCNPPGGFGLTCEITHSPSKPLPCDGPALVERVVADCKRVGMLRDDDVVLCAEQVDMPCAYVVYDHARAANVQRIRDWLGGFGIVLAGRYAEWEYYNSDHAFVAGRKAARRSLANLARAAAGAPSAATAGAAAAANAV